MIRAIECRAMYQGLWSRINGAFNYCGNGFLIALLISIPAVLIGDALFANRMLWAGLREAIRWLSPLLGLLIGLVVGLMKLGKKNRNQENKELHQNLGRKTIPG